MGHIAIYEERIQAGGAHRIAHLCEPVIDVALREQRLIPLGQPVPQNRNADETHTFWYTFRSSTHRRSYPVSVTMIISPNAR